MAHPFENIRQHKVEKNRASAIAHGYATGGKVHSDAAEDRKMIKGMVKPGALKVEGRATGGRLDRPARASGGKVKSGKTNVNIVIAPQGGGAGAAPPAVPLAPPVAAGPPPMPPPMPPGIPHSRGGRSRYASGGSVKEQSIRNGTPVQHTDGKNDGGDIYRGKQITYASGGAIEANRMGPKMTAGDNGEGRKQKIAIQKRSTAP